MRRRSGTSALFVCRHLKSRSSRNGQHTAAAIAQCGQLAVRCSLLTSSLCLTCLICVVATCTAVSAHSACVARRRVVAAASAAPSSAPLSLMAVPLPAPSISIDFEREFKHSAKTAKLLHELACLKREDPGVKSLVFSQWTSMLDIVQIPLQRGGIQVPQAGRLAQSEGARAAAAQVQGQTPSYTLLLISLKAGGVGLNLVSASCVFFLDWSDDTLTHSRLRSQQASCMLLTFGVLRVACVHSWWNPAVEQQAIDRVHRIGQTRTVRVKRFVIVDSVEERILEMQDRKMRLANSVHSNDAAAGNVGDVNLLLECLR